MEKETAVAASAILLLAVSEGGPRQCWVLGSARSNLAGGGGPQVDRRLQHSL